jgi:hypothetical protein
MEHLTTTEHAPAQDAPDELAPLAQPRGPITARALFENVIDGEGNPIFPSADLDALESADLPPTFKEAAKRLIGTVAIFAVEPLSQAFTQVNGSRDLLGAHAALRLCRASLACIENALEVSTEDRAQWLRDELEMLGARDDEPLETDAREAVAA